MQETGLAHMVYFESIKIILLFSLLNNFNKYAVIYFYAEITASN